MAWIWILKRCRAAGAQRKEEQGKEELREDGDLALACAQRAHGAPPETGVSARTLGCVHYHLGHLDEARPLLAAAWLLDQRLFSAVLHLAMLEKRSGKDGEARKLFDRASADGRKRLMEGTAIRESFECIRGAAERLIAGEAWE